MNRTKLVFLRWACGLASAYIFALVALDYFMWTGRLTEARVVLLLLAGVMPGAVLAAYAMLRRVHLDTPHDDLREVTVPLVIGIACAVAVSVATILIR